MLSWTGSYTRGGGGSTDGYRRVTREETPHMTFKGYTAIANLEVTTKSTDTGSTRVAPMKTV